MPPRAALLLSVALLYSCSPQKENKTEKSSPDYPRTLSLIDFINQSANASKPDPMAILLKNHKDVLKLLEGNNYPVTLLWVKPESFEKYAQEKGLDLKNLRKNANLSSFLKSHIYKGDIPELSNNLRIDSSKLYQSYSGLVWSVGNTPTNRIAPISKTINGINVDGCYFVERGPTEEDSKFLGRICYINAPIIDLIR